MTSERTRKRASQHLLVAVTLAMMASLASCQQRSKAGEPLGSVRVVMRAQSPLDVARVTLVIQGGNLPSPRSETIPGGSGHLELLVGGLPAGTGYSFTASGADAQGVVLYQGSATADIVANQTVTVLITLLQVTAPPPFQNAAPVIDSVVIAPAEVAPGETVAVSVAAHDPNPQDVLSFAWTASGGAFANAAAATTTWTAPSATGNYDLTIQVSDDHGASTMVSGTVRVAVTSETGSADVSMSFDSSPTVLGLNANPGWLAVGVATALTVQATDPDGDAIVYQWSSTCAGTFGGGGATNSFTLGASETAKSCAITATVTDPAGLAASGELTLPTGKPVVGEPPLITSSLQSLAAAEPGQAVTFEVRATDPNGEALSFAWSASAGTLSDANNTATTSTVVWTAPSTPATDWQVTVKVSNTSGLSIAKAFPVKLAQAVDGGIGGSDGGGTGGVPGSGGSPGSGGTGSGGAAGSGAGGSGGSQAGSVKLSVAPGSSPGSAKVSASLVDSTDAIVAIAVSVSPDNVTASANAAEVVVTGLAAKTAHTFTVTVTTSSGATLTATTAALAFYDVLATFHEPEVEDSTFTGAYTFDGVAGAVSNLAGSLFDGMGATATLPYQLSAQSVTLGGMSGQLVATFVLSVTPTFVDGSWAPGGTKTYGNHNGYALIFVPAGDPSQSLGADQINWLAYADCTTGGLMGSTCMTGTTVAAYGRVGTMGGYPTSQVTTLR